MNEHLIDIESCRSGGIAYSTWKIAQYELTVDEEHAFVPERHGLTDAIISGESAIAFGNKNRRQCERRNHKRNAHRFPMSH
jgi:hypothetical protein